MIKCNNSSHIKDRQALDKIAKLVLPNIDLRLGYSRDFIVAMVEKRIKQLNLQEQKLNKAKHIILDLLDSIPAGLDCTDFHHTSRDKPCPDKQGLCPPLARLIDSCSEARKFIESE